MKIDLWGLKKYLKPAKIIRMRHEFTPGILRRKAEGRLPALDFRDAQMLEIAEMYYAFPAIADGIAPFERALAKTETDPEFSQEIERLLQNLRRAVDLVRTALDTQEKYNLADKRWIRDTTSLEEALARGRLVTELDIRLDKQGEPWVSHAVGAHNSFTPPYIHEQTTEEMEKGGVRFKLIDGLRALQRYQDRGHKFILELKTLGETPVEQRKNLKHLSRMLLETGTEPSIAVASLSPGILMAAADVLPRTPLILNGGIIPGISYTPGGERLVNAVLPADQKWHAYGIPKLFEVVVSASERTVERADGQDIQTGYALTKLPSDLLTVLQQQAKQPERFGKFGGVVSLSAVTIAASALDTLGDHDKAQKLRAYYANVVKELGVNVMATTWGQGAGAIPGLTHLSAEKQIATFKRELGPQTLVYTKGPEKVWETLE